MKPLPLLCLALIALTPAQAIAKGRAVTPEGILRAEEHLSYDGTLLINGVQRVHVRRDKDQRRREEFMGPDGRVANLLVLDGTTRWHYVPAQSLVQLMPQLDMATMRARLALLHRNYRFHVMGAGRKADRSVVIARFYPRYEGNLRHLLWVDQQKGLPLAVERRAIDGKLVDRSEFLNIRFDAPMAADLFRFQVPPGARVRSTLTPLASGGPGLPPPKGMPFQPPLPKTLPGGYALLAWQYFTSARQIPTFNWTFSDGLNTLSLFAVDGRHRPRVPSSARVVSLGKATGFVVDQGASRMMMWSARGASYTLVGHLPEADLVKVARSTL